MLRLSLVLITSIIFSSLNAQNWNLFPVKQLSHYQVDAENYALRSFKCDSVNKLDDTTFHYFIRYQGPNKECYWQNIQWWHRGTQFDFIIDSLVYFNDSMVFNFLLDGHNYNFVFKPHAKVDEEWTTSGNGRKAICTSIGVQEIFGISDSVKTFKLVTAAYGDVEFQLSKTYGLLQFISFIEFFLEVPLINQNTIPYYRLIGYQSKSKTLGFQLPGFSDYFHHSVGDILLWRYSFYTNYDLTTTYLRDSILNSALLPDSVSYQISREVYDIYFNHTETKTVEVTHYRNTWDWLLKAPFDWVSSRNEQDSTGLYSIDSCNFVFSGNDTTVIYQFGEDGCVFEQSDGQCYPVCLDSDNFYSSTYKLSSKEGLTYSWKGFGQTRILLGSKIDGILRGSLELPVGIENRSSRPIIIYPNPASGAIQLQNISNIDRIEVYNSLGTIVYAGQGKTELDLSNLPVGYYHLVVYTAKGERYSQKLILSR